MAEDQLTLDNIIQMTVEVGEDWAVAHAERLLKLIEQIGAEIQYDFQIMELAAYMHDWGAFPKYIQRDVGHAIRSRQAVESEILPYLNLTTDPKDISRLAGIQSRFTIPCAQEIANVRVERMEISLGWLAEESFGML